MFGLITLTLVINYALLGWAKKLKSSKCWWGQTSHACSFQDMWKWKSATKSWLRPRLRNEQERFWRHLTTAVKQKHVSGHFIACASWNNLTSYLLDEKKKTSESSSNPFYVSFLSYELSVRYYLCCTDFTDSGTFYSLITYGVYMADSASGQDEPILSAREYLLCPARKDFVLTTW